MPFTFSHTAATLLFKPWLQKQKLSYTGLILGCMAPDFEYFLRMKMQGEIGHHWIGIFLFDLPVSIIIALLIHCIIRDQLIEYLPKELKQRFIPYQHQNWLAYLKQHFGVVIISILFGILTHIVWDAFTHKTGFFVQKISLLQHVVHVGNLQIFIFKFLQHASAVLGLLIVMLCIYHMPKVAILPQKDQRQKVYWFMVLFCLISIFGLRMLFYPSLMQSIVNILVVGIASSFWSILLVSLIFKLLKFNNKAINS